MSTPQLEIQLIAVLVAATCALPGTFLVLRRMALVSDAISHSILLGIVLAFFVVEDLTSPLLLVGAALFGLVNVVLTELVSSTRLVKEDTAIGLVFPLLFALGVILISRYAGSVHLDVDAVLMGELAFAPFDRFVVAGRDIGAKAIYLAAGLLLINIVFIGAFHKELKLLTFDPGLAASLGLVPQVLNYSFLGLVSVTAVGVFDAVGSILVVALMIVPPAAAYLLTRGLSLMLLLAVVLGMAGAFLGYWLAHLLDASIAGSIATVQGGIFVLAYLFAPKRGLLTAIRSKREQKWDFAQRMLILHLFNHERLPGSEFERQVGHLEKHFAWDDFFARQVVKRAIKRRLVVEADGELTLTEIGRQLAREVAVG